MTALFDGFFDDAALFPPGDAPMALAVPAHRDMRSLLGPLVGPFVVPGTRLEELSAHLDAGPPLGLSLIAPAADLPAARRRIDADERLALAAVDVPIAGDAGTARDVVRVLDEVTPADVPAAVELPRSAQRDEVLDVLAGTRYRAKLRTGGERPDLFPSAEELAGTLVACVTRGVAVKCTAGLHRAVRHTDPVSGFEHHGFLNIMRAVHGITAGDSVERAADHLRQKDPAELSAALRAWPPGEAAEVRKVFASFGTCSVREPVDDLVTLGLLTSREEVRA